MEDAKWKKLKTKIEGTRKYFQEKLRQGIHKEGVISTIYLIQQIIFYIEMEEEVRSIQETHGED